MYSECAVVFFFYDIGDSVMKAKKNTYSLRSPGGLDTGNTKIVAPLLHSTVRGRVLMWKVVTVVHPSNLLDQVREVRSTRFKSHTL